MFTAIAGGSLNDFTAHSELINLSNYAPKNVHRLHKHCQYQFTTINL